MRLYISCNPSVLQLEVIELDQPLSEAGVLKHLETVRWWQRSSLFRFIRAHLRRYMEVEITETCSYIGACQAANGKSSPNIFQSPLFDGLRGDLLPFHLIVFRTCQAMAHFEEIDLVHKAPGIRGFPREVGWRLAATFVLDPNCIKSHRKKEHKGRPQTGMRGEDVRSWQGSRTRPLRTPSTPVEQQHRTDHIKRTIVSSGQWPSN